jgi:DNA-binding transcriptional LysR family regulator
LDGIVMRSLQSGRIRHWTMRDAAGAQVPAPLKEAFVFNDPAAMRRSALLGLGVAMLVMTDIIDDLESGSLIRLVPRWYADAGAISIYFASRTLLPGKTRVFVDCVVDAFKQRRLAERFAGSLG